MKRQYNYPLLITLGLVSRDKDLLRYYLGKELREIDYQPGNFVSLCLEHQREGICCLISADFKSIREIAQWNIPVLLVARLGQELKRSELYTFLLKTGLCALWILPDYGESVIFPRLALNSYKRQSVLLVEEQEERRRLFFQLYTFAGYDVRLDCSSAQEVLLCLKNDGPPTLLHLNLDHSAMKATELIYALDSFLKINPEQKSSLRALFIKDFNIPGFSFSSLEDLLASHTSRIFSPKEAVFAIIEAFLGEQRALFPAQASPSKELFALDAILHGHPVELAKLSPSKMTSRERFPFLWLYESMAKGMKEGLYLSLERIKTA